MSRLIYGLLFATAFCGSSAHAQELAPVHCQASPSPLFSSSEVIELSMKGSFPLRARDADLEIITTAGEIGYKDASGQDKTLAVQFQARGKSKAQICAFKPVRILWNEGDKKAGSPF